ncbi:hypothetical protein [Salidesulfovibrio brasiliensis]|uniref:hypothetical protein n=1 Tax=Salidesulfovibrio brasiliensis TaxID=221711 RepID=UPI0012EDECC4|nr:hypothetical protein [Salidesulfovibrio brasiliensis]
MSFTLIGKNFKAFLAFAFFFGLLSLAGIEEPASEEALAALPSLQEWMRLGAVTLGFLVMSWLAIRYFVTGYRGKASLFPASPVFRYSRVLLRECVSNALSALAGAVVAASMLMLFAVFVESDLDVYAGFALVLGLLVYMAVYFRFTMYTLSLLVDDSFGLRPSWKLTRGLVFKAMLLLVPLLALIMGLDLALNSMDSAAVLLAFAGASGLTASLSCGVLGGWYLAIERAYREPEVVTGASGSF